VAISRRLNPERGLVAYWQIVNRDEIATSCVWAIAGEVVNLPVIGPPGVTRPEVVAVTTADVEENRSSAQPTGLALDAR